LARPSPHIVFAFHARKVVYPKARPDAKRNIGAV
jgi:hypothetical protein